MNFLLEKFAHFTVFCVFRVARGDNLRIVLWKGSSLQHFGSEGGAHSPLHFDVCSHSFHLGWSVLGSDASCSVWQTLQKKSTASLKRRKEMRSFLTLAVVSALGMSANAQVQSVYNFGLLSVGAMKNLSFTNSAPAFASPGDGFGVFQRGVSATLPFALMDDSAPGIINGFPPDSQGIVSDWRPFFGVVDTENPNNTGFVSAEWGFDITGLTSMSMDIDMAAMGDFEAVAGFGPADSFTFSFDIDGGGFTNLFTHSINAAGSKSYTLAGGGVFLLQDPLSMNGVELSNIFQTLSAAITGTGSTLTLRLTVQADGGSEAFAIDKIVLNGVPTPGAFALLGLGGLAAARRRRH
jgi:MYXO-CTERM domain-containing protein